MTLIAPYLKHRPGGAVRIVATFSHDDGITLHTVAALVYPGDERTIRGNIDGVPTHLPEDLRDALLDLIPAA
jgi:hypothetical protein